MTKKNFETFAKEFAYAHREQIGGSLSVQEEIMLEAFICACKKINPKFDEEVWMDYFWKEVFP
jgi:hypothetical protein|tara:strand:+ start:540 stop:728 length:189 start_codon:yes stop_codon:yes gene_type:complete